jgi:hypothetical protein
MSVAPEIARLAESVLFVPARPPTEPANQPDAEGLPGPPTIGTLACRLRTIAAAPEGWWGVVRFDRDRPATITVEESADHVAWLVVLPPGGAGQDCDCDVAAMIAGEPAECGVGGPDETPGNGVLRPGTLRVHGRRHTLRGSATGYSVSLHARAKRGEQKNLTRGQAPPAVQY